ncbi:RagB/SusD family nutrient uptake outer membrane protein [Sphingobacterium chuzhouense]|uniref:RagB/SusD family nutrient uptake outer membrane protein n=1 Tax=Sphingobacterium chuzhouense TaxID=1742264 RepID=A0ABR7XNR7_9SPHI|nr:RagB/SusD family nutrient uptake outer membrane protein [Sphingobacterium chuzhouense]MBD1420820.1 RagB/SusD family nutrient uptake outer membrane protein [Sphingobacterium chuzhouense]
MKNKLLIAISTLILGLSSCSDSYLDVSDELAGGLQSVDEIFDNPSYTRRWYANIFTGIPDYSEMVRADWDGGGQTGLHNPWTGMTDEINTSYGDNANYMISVRNSSNMGFHRWNILYQLIRQANIFLEKAKVIPASGTNADQLTEEEFNRMRISALFVRAYYHYLLMEQYGPIPIMDRAYGPLEDLDVPRRPLDDVINFIDSELTAVIPLLPQSPITDDNFKALPTKGVALALRGKLWIFAASPLFNGGFQEALSLTNSDGTSLFPAADPSKWNKAEQALREFIEYADAGNYELFTVRDNNGNIDPDQSVYRVFQEYSKEIIWATSVNGFNGIEWGDRFERRSTPRSEPNGIGSTAVVQELVDDFYMKDGLPISSTGFLNGSPLYSEIGTSELNGVQVYNMWIDREPRFYNTVFFAGRRWHISNNVTHFYMGSPNDRSGQHTPNGYLLYKRYNRTVHMVSPGVRMVFRPSIIFRLAEFYLLYAEALNEVEPGNPNVLEYINRVRERAGLPALQVLNPAIVGNRDLQRQAIRRESRIELATEGQRYFDVRRWMIAEDTEGRQGGDFHGMNMAGSETTFYQRTWFQTRYFERKQYFHPIPFTEMQKSKVLVQNPGW